MGPLRQMKCVKQPGKLLKITVTLQNGSSETMNYLPHVCNKNRDIVSDLS